jgi:hypothetical protein
MSNTLPKHAGTASGGAVSIVVPVLAGPGLIVLWVLLMALAYVLFEPGRTVMIFGPQSKTFAAVVKADAQVLSSGDGFIVVRGQQDGYVRKLYSGGAWLVMPTSEMMCGHPGALRKIATGR